jgi:hypothetical protein
MNSLNILFSLTSLSVLLVTVERFSFTTKILLQPYGFLRLHELVQMSLLILFTTVIPFFLFRHITHDFETLKQKKGLIWAVLFIIGIYFYATGNGVHEISSFNFNTFCNPKHFAGNLCSGFFFNDYYTGNILYFIGAILMTVPLFFLEILKPSKEYKKKDLAITLVNAVIYALAIFAYAAFDVVLVGLVYSLIVMLIADVLFFLVRKKYLEHPFITYSAVTYTLGTLAALLVRFH